VLSCGNNTRCGGRLAVAALLNTDYMAENPTKGDIGALVESISKTRSPTKRTRLEAQLRAFLRSNGSPVTNVDAVHFFYQDPESRQVSITGDWNGWQPGATPLTKLHPKSTLYHVEQTFPIDAALPYRFVVDGQSVLDPLNQILLPGPLGTNSFFSMPGYPGVPYWYLSPDDVPRGRLIELNAHGNANVIGRTVGIYIPHGHEPNGPQRFLYVNDGAEAITIGRFNTVLDNLFHFEPLLAKVIVVFVPPLDRHGEYMMNPEFAKWFANDLTKQVEKKLRSTSKAAMRAVQGASLGGLFAAYLGLTYSNRFKNIVSQSPSFWVDDYSIVKRFSRSKHLPLRIYIHTGTIHDAHEGTRRMLPVLQQKGYDVTYRETSESHNWANWAGQYAAMVRWMGK
jgi:enterochelin esterase-like enzyme